MRTQGSTNQQRTSGEPHVHRMGRERRSEARRRPVDANTERRAFMIAIKKILCPVDFFPASDAAVNYAANLAGKYEASVHLLHVVMPVAVGTYECAIDTTEILKSWEERATQEMMKLATRVK